MKDRTSEFTTFAKGARVQLHPAHSLWMQGARFGTVLGHTRLRECWERGSEAHYLCRLVRVKLDKLAKPVRVHPDNLTPAD